MNDRRHPQGTPTGGQFAPTGRDEADFELDLQQSPSAVDPGQRLKDVEGEPVDWEHIQLVEVQNLQNGDTVVAIAEEGENILVAWRVEDRSLKGVFADGDPHGDIDLSVHNRSLDDFRPDTMLDVWNPPTGQSDKPAD